MAVVSWSQEDVDAPYQMVEKMPVWHSCDPELAGDEAMNCTSSSIASFVVDRVNYSRKLRKQHVQGTVIVQFVIEKDGSVIDVNVVRSVHPQLDEQVVDAVLELPNFIPGQQRGKAVRVQFALPVKFSL